MDGGSTFPTPKEPTSLLLELQGRHVYYISPSKANILAGVHRGYTNGEIADYMGCSPATVRRHVADMIQRVFDISYVDGSRDKLRTWTPFHFHCCAMAVAEMVENDQIFASSDQQPSAPARQHGSPSAR